MTDKLIGLEEVAREWMRHQHDLPTWLDASNGQRRIARRRAADLIRTLDAARGMETCAECNGEGKMPWEPGEQIWNPGGGSYTTERVPPGGKVRCGECGGAGVVPGLAPAPTEDG